MERCWHSKISEFLNIKDEEIIKALIDLGFNVGQLQINAWQDCIVFLKRELTKLSKSQKEVTIIFEYKLENGMRPDVLILTKTNLLVLEFKSGENAASYRIAHFDQVEDYAMRFENYHEFTHNNKLNVNHYIIYTHPLIQLREIGILTQDNFFKVINEKISEPLSNKDVSNWINSKYEAIPAILEAVDLVFNPEELPNIMMSKSNIQEVLNTVKSIVENNAKKSLNVILVSGDPGAGKTLLGLKLVKDYIKAYKSNSAAVYLSGNRPLVEVLRYQIDIACSKLSGQRKPYGEAYIKAVNNYIQPIINVLSSKTSDKKTQVVNHLQKEKIIVFDEAQRAWGKDQMEKKHKLNASQPEVLLYSLTQSVNFLKESKTLVCLVGDGQEIYLGEEDGIKNWTSALSRFKNSGHFKIYAPSKYKEQLNIEGVELHFNDNLYLNSYLRGHGANIFPQWIEAVLSNNIGNAKKLLKCIYNEQKHFPIYITRSLKVAKGHLKERYDESLNTFGVITSSFSQNGLEQIEGIKLISNKNLGNWYKEECRSFKYFVTEFESQGLEVDFPVVYWGIDLIRKYDKWERHTTLRRANDGKPYEGMRSYKDPLKILKNIYRVLLTRGRNGLIICIPDHPLLVETYNFFVQEIGVIEIN